MGDAAPPHDTPLVLVARNGRQRVVTALNMAALAAGLRAGMPATKAQALLVGLLVLDAEPMADEAALGRLAVWALRRYSPVVAADPPDGLVIDATGAAHLHGGEDAMLGDIVHRLKAAGITTKAALADTLGAAHALARFAGLSSIVIPPGRSSDAILPLPIASLRLPVAMVGDLRRLGFERISDIAARPRAPLTLRFGPEPGRRLDQAMGRLDEPIDPVRTPELLEVRRNFAEPIGAAETLARYTGLLTTQLCQLLYTQGLGARRLDLLFHRIDNRIESIRIGTALPVRDAKRLTRLLCGRIETVDPGFGVEMMRLAATLTEAVRPKQASSALTGEHDSDVSDLIDTLANRVGEERLYRFAAVESDLPERSIRKVVPLADRTEERWPLHWPRPTRLLATPEPVETLALLPDHPPVHFTWRGSRRRVKRADGPERVFGEWGRGDTELALVRDYFQVETEAGERFWLYREGDGLDAATGSQRWFLHGIFA